MRRSTLITISALGLVICLLGGTGLFAALTDTADTGTNDIDSGPLAGSADLQLATLVPDPAFPGSLMCGDWVEDLATGLFDASNLQPGGGGPSNKVCIRNVGSQTVGLTIGAFELEDTETGCTGDEEDYGDTTCGSGAGELSAVLQIRIQQTACADNDPAGGPGDLGARGPGGHTDRAAGPRPERRALLCVRRVPARPAGDRRGAGRPD